MNCPRCQKVLSHIQSLEGKEGICSFLGYCVNCEAIVSMKLIEFNDVVQGKA